jgi:hypothetical protein
MRVLKAAYRSIFSKNYEIVQSLLGQVPALAIATVVFLLLVAPGTARAVIVPAGSHTFDANLPGNAFVAFDGTKFSTPALPPTSTLGVSIDGGLLFQGYPSTSVTIISGFSVTSVYVMDPTLSGSIAPGDAVFGSIGPGAFSISDGVGVILTGSFTSATLTSAVGATAGSLTASTINGLVLTPGPAFTFDTTFVSAIAPSPAGFSISLSSIPLGVSAVPAGPPIGPFIPASLLPMAPSSGSTVVSGVMTVVPEPSTLTLGALGLIGTMAIAIRKRRRANMA